MRIAEIDMDDLVSMGDGALYNAHNLTTFTAPNLKSMGDYALLYAPCRKDVKCV